MPKKRKVRVWRKGNDYIPPAQRVEPGTTTARPEAKIAETVAVSLSRTLLRGLQGEELVKMLERIAATGVKLSQLLPAEDTIQLNRIPRPKLADRGETADIIASRWAEISNRRRKHYSIQATGLKRFGTSRLVKGEMRRVEYNPLALNDKRLRARSPKKVQGKKRKFTLTIDPDTVDLRDLATTPVRQEIVTIAGTTRVTLGR